MSRLTALLCCLLLGAIGLMAQSATGTVTGVITDEQGAVIPGADVRLVDATTGSARTAQTNEEGRFTIVNVPPGTYNATVTKGGFQISKASNQKVDIGETLTLSMALKIGTAATTIEVTATAGADLQTLNATIGSTITNESLQLLPNLGRDASSLSVLQVGVSLSGNVAGAAT
ncbi:MAG TPA: carboxypeptidase regulatory-like domain-containing protein, partial [Bryobacteraceae bacterium]